MGGSATADSSRSGQAASGEGNATQSAASTSPGCLSNLFSLLGCFAQLCCAQESNFLRQKAREADVVQTPSGLLYKVVRRGAGKRHPGKDSVCVCHYKGTLVNGRPGN